MSSNGPCLIAMHLVLEVLATARALEKAGQRIFRPHGLSTAQFNILNLLSDQPEGMRASDLARSLIVDPSSITGLLRRMKKEGYLKELDNQADRREHVVGLAPKGQKAWHAAFRDYQRSLKEIQAAFKPADEAATRRILAGIGNYTSS